jgi:peptidoglycan/xylan/chitin deacetylase (PgdA/CDA1 family)
VRRALSRVAYAALVGAGTARIFRHANRGRLAVLMYHGLHAGEADAVMNFDGLHLHVARFERQMRYLARHYRVVPLEESAEPGAPGRVVLTFDDGYASVYRHAFPVLDRLGLPATVFVATDFVGGGGLMWWDRLRLAVRNTRAAALTLDAGRGPERWATGTTAEKVATVRALHARLEALAPAARGRLLDALDGGRPARDRALVEPMTLEQMRAMAGRGIAFQSHGVSHCAFGTLSTAALIAEVRESRAILEGWLGRPVRWLAYPFGDRDRRAREALAAAGYAGAVSCREALGGPGDDPFAIPRIAVGDPISHAQFVAALSGLRALGRLVRRAEPVA